MAKKRIIKNVIKRDGRTEPYKRKKIAGAIEKAILAVRGQAGPELTSRLTDLAEEKLKQFMSTRHPNSAPAIEEIQDIVENVLMEDRQFDIARAYIIYRARHEIIRDTRKLMLDINNTMDGYLSQSDWRVKENAYQ